MAVRGSVWKNSSKKKGYSASVGSYGYSKNGDRFFILTSQKTGKNREYSSPAKAEQDGWFIVDHGK